MVKESSSQMINHLTSSRHADGDFHTFWSTPAYLAIRMDKREF